MAPTRAAPTCVSIHAPVKGATIAAAGRSVLRPVSIHARVKGATGRCRAVKTLDFVSIHAPVKGATIALIFYRAMRCSFNPRSREGSDALAWILSDRGSRFNPRSREGSDRMGAWDMEFDIAVSIHAPVKGATP